MNLRDIAKKVGSYISSKTQDDEGFFRQGKFTPVKQISEIKTPTGTLGQNVKQVFSGVINKSFNPYSRIAENTQNNSFLRGGADIVNQGLKSYVNMGTLGLVQPKMGEQQTKVGTIGKLAGGIAGFTGGIGGKMMGGLDTLGQSAIKRFTPNLQRTLAGKIVGGLGKEALQTAGYMGSKYLSGKVGLRPEEKITGKSILQDLSFGAAMRGITTPGNLGAIRKAISPDVWTSDRSVINEAMQRIKVNETVDEFSDIGKNLKNMYKEYGLASYPNWNKLPQRQQVQILSDRLDEMARSGFDIKMGIKDQSQPNIGGVSTPQKLDIEHKKNVLFDKINAIDDKLNKYHGENVDVNGNWTPLSKSRRTQVEIQIDILAKQKQKLLDELDNLSSKTSSNANIPLSNTNLQEANQLPIVKQNIKEKLPLSQTLNQTSPIIPSQISPEVKTGGVSTPQNEFKKLGFQTKGDNVVIHRGTGPSSPLEGNYFTGDKEYAREFLGSGRPEELKTVTVPIKDIYKPNVLPEAVNEQQMTSAILEAKQKGFKALLVDEGGASTPSVFYIDKVKPDFYNPVSQISPESKGIIKLKDNDLVKTFDETIKIKPSEKVKVSSMSIEQPELKQRGFSASVQEAPDISKKTKIKVLGGYEQKPNEQLMGEAKALLNEGVDLKNINKIENIDQKIAATIQEAINLDASGKHDEAAALFNNLSELGTQVGRGTQAFSLLNKMSPEAISLSVAGKIKKYNLSNVKKLPELTGDQQKSLSNQVREALKFPEGSRERGIAIGRVNETINSFIPSTIADKFITAWKAGLLSSLRTHERNIVGNVIMQTGEQASLYPASLADKLMSLKTGTRTLVPSQKGTIKGAIEGGQTAADVVRYGFDPMGTDIAKYEIKKVNWGNNPVEQALKKATDVVFNTLEAEDKVFWKSSYNRSLYNQAATEALNQGKKGDTKFIQQLFDNATEEMKKTAFNDANYSTFKDKNMLSGSIGQFKSWVNRQTGPAAEAGKVVSEMLMPFTGVPTSIVGKTIAYSPIGLVKGSINFGRVVSGSEVPGLQRQAAQEIGRGVIGVGIFGLGSYLMSQGLMTGQAKDEKERKQWELEGKQENSVLVNGKWRSINSVGPQTLVLLAGAKFNEMQNDPEQNLGTYGFSMAKDQLNQTFLSGVQQPLSALNEPYKAKSYLGGQVASLVPNIIKDVSKAFDPLAREVDTSTIGSSIKGRVQQSIPFVRNKMIPQRDVLGNEIAQTPTGIGAYVDLFNSKTPISNNVVNELSRLNDIGYNKTPTKLDKNQTIQGEKMVLNQAQLDRLEIVSGLATDKALNDLFNTTAYQSLNDAEKQDAIEDVITKTRKNVRAKINLKNIEEKSYTTSSDSQLAELGGFGMFTKSVTTNPKSAINALLTGNPIRKTSDGNIVVLERQNDIGSYDLGDTASQVDHSIPLSLGGTNEVRNLQILTNEEHAIKTKTDMYLLNQVKSGKMSLKEAQEKAKNWRDTALSIPKESQSQIIDEINSETAEKQSDGSQVYKIVSDTGNVTLVDLGTPIKEPEHTGFTEVDKKLKSSYKSAITKRINNIIKLYEDGQLSAKEAERYINELKTQSSATGTKSTKSKGGKITIKSAKYDIPKINIKFQSPTSTIKLKSAPKIKISKTDNRKYTIKA